MNFKWNETKCVSNILKHGIDFVDCETVFAGFTVTLVDNRFAYGEERFITLGVAEGRIVSVAHTETEESIRFISVRKATAYEQEKYLKELYNNFPD